jgi:periplasmic copper chaperone A
MTSDLTRSASPMTRRIAPVAAVVAAALIAPAAAAAHVTVQRASAPAGAETVLTVRVPNERDDASTVKLDVRLPPGFVSAAWESTPGWSVRALKQKLSKPIQTDDGPIDEQISEVVWTASSKGTGIQPGEFRDFPLSVLIPGKAGQTLTFKALRTYSNGTVVRWIGAPGSDAPAPHVKLTNASATTGTAKSTSGSGGQSQSAPAPAPAATADSDSNGLSIVALVLGALGLLIGIAAFVVAGRGAAGRAERAR